MQPGPNGEQVTDFAYDEDSGLLAVGPEPSAVDIITIKYAATTVGKLTTISGTMKVSQLTTVPPNTTWKMYFTANAPETGLVNISGSSYSKGLSDDGDQFFIQASTDNNGVPSYQYGTTMREFSGATTDTVVGSADSGSINQTNFTVTVNVSATKLNAILSAAGHKLIAKKSVFCGLRGFAFTVDSLALEDITRGGTEFSVP
jgi:hypothetical protein